MKVDDVVVLLAQQVSYLWEQPPDRDTRAMEPPLGKGTDLPR